MKAVWLAARRDSDTFLTPTDNMDHQAQYLLLRFCMSQIPSYYARSLGPSEAFEEFDAAGKDYLEDLIAHMPEDKLLAASLPVRYGGIGCRRWGYHSAAALTAASHTIGSYKRLLPKDIRFCLDTMPAEKQRVNAAIANFSDNSKAMLNRFLETHMNPQDELKELQTELSDALDNDVYGSIHRRCHKRLREAGDVESEWLAKNDCISLSCRTQQFASCWLDFQSSIQQPLALSLRVAHPQEGDLSLW